MTTQSVFRLQRLDDIKAATIARTVSAGCPVQMNVKRVSGRHPMRKLKLKHRFLCPNLQCRNNIVPLEK